MWNNVVVFTFKVKNLNAANHSRCKLILSSSLFICQMRGTQLVTTYNDSETKEVHEVICDVCSSTIRLMKTGHLAKCFFVLKWCSSWGRRDLFTDALCRNFSICARTVIFNIFQNTLCPRCCNSELAARIQVGQGGRGRLLLVYTIVLVIDGVIDHDDAYLSHYC